MHTSICIMVLTSNTSQKTFLNLIHGEGVLTFGSCISWNFETSCDDSTRKDFKVLYKWVCLQQCLGNLCNISTLIVLQASVLNIVFRLLFVWICGLLTGIPDTDSNNWNWYMLLHFLFDWNHFRQRCKHSLEELVC